MRRPTHLANLDLNLLSVLEALLSERSVTRAARRLGRTQPAVSAALAKLRRHFGDELLLRSGNRYELSPLAVQLVEPVEVATAAARRVFSAQPTFDPAHSTREFVVLMSDYSLAVLGEPLARLTAYRAPQVRLHVQQTSTDAVDHAHDVLRTADALVLPHGFLSDLPHADLYTDDWVCLASTDNDAVEEELTTDQLSELPWVVTYHRPTAFTPATLQMRARGIEPRISMVVESFVTLPLLITGTDRVALIQHRLADRFRGVPGLRVLECPFPADPLVEALWWHPMNTHDPAHRWLRELIAEAAQDC